MTSKQDSEFHLNRWLFGAGAGIGLLLAESLSASKGDYYLYLPSLPLIMFPSLLGIAGVYFASMLKIYHRPPSKLFLSSLAVFVIYIAMMLYQAKADSSSLEAIGLPCFIVASLIILYMMENRFGVLSGLGQAGFFFLLFILWSWIEPETKVLGGEEQVLLWVIHFVMLAMIIVFGYRGIALTGIRPRWLGLALVAGLVLVIILGPRGWHKGNLISPRDSYEPIESTGQISSTSNTIVIVVDTLRKDHLSIYGYERRTSPFLEEWAEECQIFTNAVSVSPWTLPAHASLFTGLFPRSHGAHIFLPKSKEDIPIINSYPLGLRFRTLAEIFREHGFETGAVVSNKSFVSKRFGMDQGFDYFDQGEDNPRILFARSDFIEFIACRILDMLPVEIPYILAEEVNARALAWTQKRKEKSFFLFLNYMDTHWPFLPPPPYRDVFPGRKKGLFRKIEEYMNLKERMLSKISITAWEKDHLISQYDGSILYFDESFRKLINGLGQQGLLENTYIYLLSDHGESFGDHGFVDHANDLYENEIAIPLFILHPLKGKTGKFDSPVFTVDLFPTILINAGIDPPVGVEGAPITEAVSEGAGIPARPLDPVAELYYTNWQWLFSAYGDRFKRIRRAVYRDGFKVIVSTDGKNEVYDLESDPDELNNLVSTRPELLREAEAEVNRFLDMTVEPPPAAWPDMDQETIELMKALGYLR